MRRPAREPVSIVPGGGSGPAANEPAAQKGLVRVRFADLPGWDADDHAHAFRTFQNSSVKLGAGHGPLAAICNRVAARGKARVGPDEARGFFEHCFSPHTITPTSENGAGGDAHPDLEPRGLLTGYYEPVIDASRIRADRFTVPLYRRPPDLETVVDDAMRGAPSVGFTHMRRTTEGLQPYFTRAEINSGALVGQGLELAWLTDPVDAFFVQVQGSGRLRFADGDSERITYDGKNGHPYSSIGRHLIDQGAMDAAAMSLETLAAYLRADVVRGREVMQHNASFVFFRALTGRDAASAQGVLGCPLTAGRSLAVDASIHALGTPIFVDAPTLTHAGGGRAFRRLMIAQDVGSAIRGAQRGDIYFGSGARAGAQAGITKHACRFYVLVPNDLEAARPLTGRSR